MSGAATAQQAFASAGSASKSPRLETPSLSEGRIEALLKGTVPVFDQGLARAYRTALSKLGSDQDKGDGPKDEFSPEEVCSLLTAGGELRKLAIFVLQQLALQATAGDKSSAENLRACISSGVLSIMSDELLELLTSQQHSQSFDQVTAAVQFFSATFAFEFLPADNAHGVPMKHIVSLFACIAALLTGSLAEGQVDVAGAAAAAAADKLECCIALMKAVRWFRFHPASDDDSILQEVNKEGGVMNSPQVISAALALIRKHPTHPGSGTIARFVLAGGTDFVQFLITLDAIDGFKQLVDLVSSTTLCEDALTWVLVSLCNISGVEDTRFSTKLVENDALLMLQPAMMHCNPVISLQASLSLARLGSLKCFAEAFASSGAESALADAMQMCTPGMVKSGVVFGSADTPVYSAMLSQDLNPMFNLAALLDVSCGVEVVGGKIATNTAALFSSPQFISALRACASSSNAFVYSAACYILRAFDLPVPTFRGGLESRGGGEASDRLLRLDDVDNWSIDQVCQWIGNQPFKAYRQAFRDNLVSGALLLAVSDEDLLSIGIGKVMHRKAILHAVNALRAVSAAAAAAAAAAADTTAAAIGAAAGSNSGVNGNLTSNSNEASLIMGTRGLASARYDVFISYRRLGGADFAQLVKLTLERKGLTVFLDIDNLGTGNFDSKLEASLLASTNIVMVWTKNCMDRFMDGKDTVRADFVRKEYALALLHKKNIVPLYKEDFEFPSPDRLPEDVRGVLLINSIKFVGEYREATFDKLVKALVPSS